MYVVWQIKVGAHGYHAECIYSGPSRRMAVAVAMDGYDLDAVYETVVVDETDWGYVVVGVGSDDCLQMVVPLSHYEGPDADALRDACQTMTRWPAEVVSVVS